MKAQSIGILFLFLGIISLSSCSKKCSDVTKDDANTGSVLNDENTFIYPASGGMTGNMGGLYHIHGAHKYANNFKVSFDSGLSRESVDYNYYSILCYPMTVKCNASFVRDVTIDHTSGIVIYSITVTQCENGSCNEERNVENYVLVPAFPASYEVIYNPTFVIAE